jgi:glucose-like phosphotransferase system IIB component
MLVVIKMWEYIIVAVVILIILFAVLKLGKKDVHLELNKLVEYLGGKDNIIETESNLSRFKVTLKDVNKANKEAITKLGAKGIVEIGNELKIILGPESKTLKKYINNIQGKNK